MKDLITAMMSNEPTRRPNIEQILSFLQQHDSDTHKTRIQGVAYTCMHVLSLIIYHMTVNIFDIEV